MARKAYGNHATQVNLSTHPDDGTSPVGSAEWNADLDKEGMLGFSQQTISSATLRTIASGVATPYDTVTIVTSESSTTDDLDKLAITNTSEFDLIYLFANTGHTITLKHTASPSADGHVFTVSGADEVLSTLKPTILMRKGNYWYGYGGGGATTPTDITVADESSDTTCFPLFVTAATGDLAPKSGSNLTFNSNTGILTATGFAGPITGNVTGDVSGSSGSCTGNAATASTATTVSDNAITGAKIAMGSDAQGDVLYYNGTDYVRLAKGTAGQALKMNSGATAPEWGASGGGAHTEQGWDVYTTHTGTTTASDGTAYMFARKIDSNNDGLYIMLWKNGASTEVQIA